MALSIEKQEEVKRIIFEKAYELQTVLIGENVDCLHMMAAGVSWENLDEVCLKAAIKWFKEEFNKAKQ